MMKTFPARFGGICLLIGALFLVGQNGCGTDDPLVERLTSVDNYDPPDGASTDTADYNPTLYMRVVDSALVGIANPEPLHDVAGALDVPYTDLIERLRTARGIVESYLPENAHLPPDINLVLDEDMTYEDVTLAANICALASFPRPHLVTSSGHRVAVGIPLVHPVLGPVGWSAWVWWKADQSLLWSVWPDSGQGFRVSSIPARDGEPDMDRLVDMLRRGFAARDSLPAARDRQIVVWAYDELPYEDFMPLLDALKYPKQDSLLCGRFALLNEPVWLPPDSLVDAHSRVHP